MPTATREITQTSPLGRNVEHSAILLVDAMGGVGIRQSMKCLIGGNTVASRLSDLRLELLLQPNQFQEIEIVILVRLCHDKSQDLKSPNLIFSFVDSQ